MDANAADGRKILEVVPNTATAHTKPNLSLVNFQPNIIQIFE